MRIARCRPDDPVLLYDGVPSQPVADTVRRMCGGSPDEYAMELFDVKPSYNGKPWCTVPLEVGHNEIGDAEETDWVRLADVGRIFEQFGFPAPREIPLMPLPHQIAQKLHALTGEGERPRDLIDLQLILANSEARPVFSCKHLAMHSMRRLEYAVSALAT